MTQSAAARRCGSAWLAALAWLGLACASGARVFDPISMDPPGDEEHPPRIVETKIPSQGSALNAILYVAEGPGPHPTVVMLHGFPGNERNLDLAQAIRRGGWNVAFFHYRGAWGSPGDFSFGHVLEDVTSAVAWVGRAGGDPALRIDPRRIALVGHSMGGFAALRMGGELDAVDCVVSIAGANLGLRGALARRDPRLAAAAADQLEAWSAPLAGTSGEALVAELLEAGDDYDLVFQAPALAPKPLLLVAGYRDETTPPAQHHAPLLEALRRQNAPGLSDMIFDADHAFSQKRVALARLVTTWLGESCR